jgi:glycosyltransferase Alg8
MMHRVLQLLPEYRAKSSRESYVMGIAIYLGVAMLLLALMPRSLEFDRVFLLPFGVIGIWRWSWAGTHLVRALIYKRIVFPRLRARSASAQPPSHLYVLVTSYRMRAEMNSAVYGRLFAEIAAYGVPTMIVAAITSATDERVISRAFTRQRGLPEGCRIAFQRQKGTGKRDAMAQALRTIARQSLASDAQVILMDGDSLIGADTLRKSCQALAASPEVGAVTTENLPLVSGDAITREWYRLRMAHRDVLMSSLALSRKLLVLTGRFSVFRAEIAGSAEFIAAIERDHVDHWRLGRIAMVTGDDKSTWFMVLRHGWKMLYLPDAHIQPLEELPPGGFFLSTTQLMLRWYGNMARGNFRAVPLGPQACGWFTWTCLIDQRISPWTSLIGPTTMCIAAYLHSYGYVLAYLLWVLLSRSIICIAYWGVSGRFHPLFPFLLYYNQFCGAWIKLYAFFHPYRQKWTRQTTVEYRSDPNLRIKALTSSIYNFASVALFVMVIVAITLRINTGFSPGGAHGPVDIFAVATGR